MAARSGLYDAVREELETQLRRNPDDREAWTVYGDWLLEHGDRRGELVRSNREPTKEERERWRGPVPSERFVRWRCGFVVELEVPCSEHGIAFLAPMLADPASRLLSSLVLRQWRYEDDDQLIAAEPSDPPIDPVAVVLAQDLRRLRALAIRYIPLTDQHIDALVRTALAITELDLRYSDLTDDRLAHVLGAPWFAGVRRLHLQGNRVTDAHVERLAHLDFLDIRDTGMTAAPIEDRIPELRCYGAPAHPIQAERVAPSVPVKLAEGLTLSPQRTARFTSPRIVDKRPLSRTFTKDCERVDGRRDFIVVYVDPDEWTFRTYENILPLDRLIEAPPLALDDHCEIASEIHRFTLRGELLAFDDLPLYAKPLNAGTRGGQRYIFHAAALAESLTAAIRAALPDLRGFSHVNPVFRCNRFEPGDEPFHRHFDTPYHDAARGQISQYTLLIYLTGGTGAPALQIEDLKIESIEAMQCFVFHQAYEHAGAAYVDGRKVFLRTELVFEHADVIHEPRIAALFAKACYFTGESIRDAELARDADRAYNAVAAAHWTGVLPPRTEPFVHKQFRDYAWLANGYDFWFPKGLPLPDCATLVLLDYLNAELAGAPFRSLVAATTTRDVDPESFFTSTPPPLPVLDKAALFSPPETLGACCPGHARLSFVPTRSHDVVELYARAQRFCRTRLEPAPIAMLGSNVYLDPERFQISGNQIHVLSHSRLAPVNFAACWNWRGTPPNFVAVDFELDALQPLVPPILWEATPRTHHLMFDFFRNGWTVRRDTVAIPRIRSVDLEQVDDNDWPWIEANAERALDPGGDVHYPFWSPFSARSPLLRELYKDRL